MWVWKGTLEDDTPTPYPTSHPLSQGFRNGYLGGWHPHPLPHLPPLESRVQELCLKPEPAFYYRYWSMWCVGMEGYPGGWHPLPSPHLPPLESRIQERVPWRMTPPTLTQPPTPWVKDSGTGTLEDDTPYPYPTSHPLSQGFRNGYLGGWHPLPLPHLPPLQSRVQELYPEPEPAFYSRYWSMWRVGMEGYPGGWHPLPSPHLPPLESRVQERVPWRMTPPTLTQPPTPWVKGSGTLPEVRSSLLL